MHHDCASVAPSPCELPACVERQRMSVKVPRAPIEESTSELHCFDRMRDRKEPHVRKFWSSDLQAHRQSLRCPTAIHGDGWHMDEVDRAREADQISIGLTERVPLRVELADWWSRNR